MVDLQKLSISFISFISVFFVSFNRSVPKLALLMLALNRLPCLEPQPEAGGKYQLINSSLHGEVFAVLLSHVRRTGELLTLCLEMTT
jgi:hypothetical protein